MSKFRFILIALMITWVGFVLAAFYVVQKPLAMQVGAGLLSVLWTLTLTGLMLVDASSMGETLLRKYFPFFNSEERCLLGTGLGLGMLGLLGFGLATAGAAKPLVLLFILVSILIVGAWRGWLSQTREDARSMGQVIRSATEGNVRWIPWLAGITLLLSFTLAFAPPAESFDALMYHLAAPASWLKEGGLTTGVIIPHYWFPGLVEGTTVFGLALWSEATASLLHLAWGLLTAGLVWLWAHKAWGNATAWRSVAVLISMPSLPLLASWAYTDLALAFFSAAILFVLWRSQERSEKRLWILSGLFCGLAMGVKYTSFFLPVMVAGWLVLKYRRHLSEALIHTVRFSIAAILVASPWYVRNWVWMGNPFYPFVFGGKNWDPFLAAHYGQAGTGIGFKLSALIILPLNMTLGQFDSNYSDGRIGPLWLLLLPACLWVLWYNRKRTARWAILIPTIFGAAGLGIWTFGVVNTLSLWQTRLLFPTLIPLAPLVALGWEALSRLDMPRFRLSFIFNALVILSISATLLDLGLFVLVRNPLAVALGITSRQAYFERFQPSYADALELVDQTPPGSRVTFLFEPRSYGMSRPVEADTLLLNLAHDYYLYHTPENILRAWQSEGYSYLLYQRAGDDMLENPKESRRLFSLLEVVAETDNSILYRIPSR